MSWRRVTVLAALGYAALLGLTWLLWWLFGRTVFLVFLWIFASPLLLVVFVLVLSLLLLSIPIRYKINVKTGPAGPAAHIKAGYLLKLVRGEYVYEKGKGEMKAYVGWFRLNKKAAPKDSKTWRMVEAFMEKHVTPDGTEITAVEEMKAVAEEPKKTQDPETHQPKKSAKLADKLKGGTGFKDLRRMKDTVISYPNRKVITGLVFKAVKKALKALKPKHFDISGTIGFADPSKTGFLLGLYETLAGLFKIRKHLRLGGNFDTDATVFDLQGDVRGSISILGMTLPILGLWLKKPIRILIKDLRRKGD